MKKISKNKMQEAVKRLVETYQPLTIYLFGSYAWGKPNEESDLDFMIVVEEDTKYTFDLRKQGNRALAGIDFSVDFLFNSTSTFNDRAEHPSSLEYKIKKEGKIVYDASRAMAI
jgi:uncharacterized protein